MARRLTVLLVLSVLTLGVRPLVRAAAEPAERNQPPSDLVLKPGLYPTKWTIPEPDQDSWPWHGTGNCAASFPEVQQRLKRTPHFASSAPLYGVLVFEQSAKERQPDSTWLFAIDESKGTGKGYDTIYVDLNANGDLTDDGKTVGKVVAVPGDKAKFYGGTTFLDVAKMAYNKFYPESKNPSSVALDISYVREGEKQGVIARLRGAWIGEIESNKGRIPFRLIDANGNLRYGDLRPRDTRNNPFDLGDSIWFDWSRTGKFPKQDGYFEDKLTHLIAVNSISGRLYELKVSPDGSALDVSDYKGPTAKIEVKAGKLGQVQLKMRNGRASGDRGVYDLAVDQPTLVPAGSYIVDIDCAAAKGLGSIAYKARLTFPDNTGPYTVTVAGKPSLTIVDTSLGESSLLLTQAKMPIKLQVGEFCWSVAVLELAPGVYVTPWGDDVKGPSVVLRDSAGKNVASELIEQGEFGWMIYDGHGSVLLNGVKSGHYTLEITFDAGPFGGRLRTSCPVVVEAANPKK